MHALRVSLLHPPLVIVIALCLALGILSGCSSDTKRPEEASAHSSSEQLAHDTAFADALVKCSAFYKVVAEDMPEHEEKRQIDTVSNVMYHQSFARLTQLLGAQKAAIMIVDREKEYTAMFRSGFAQQNPAMKNILTMCMDTKHTLNQMLIEEQSSYDPI